MTVEDNTKSMSYAKASNIYAFKGLSGIVEAYDDNQVSLSVLANAVQHLRTNFNVEANDLVDWISSKLPTKPLGKKSPGRSPIQVGEVRNYKVQDVKGASTHLRIPVDAAKGWSVPVKKLENGDLLISVSAAEQPKEVEETVESSATIHAFPKA